MRISDWSSDVCSSDLAWRFCRTPHQKLYPIAERRHCERRKGGRRMSWINRVRKVIPFIAKKETTGDNLWHKCGNCGQMIFLKEWQDNLSVCPKCDHHGRIGPKARFKHIFDEGSCNVLPTPVVKEDPLRFRDSKKYTDRIKAVRSATGENDALTNAYGTIETVPVFLDGQDFAYKIGRAHV